MDGELFKGYSDELLAFASVMCIIFILIGIPGNLITIIALSKCNKTRNATAIFIINLSLSDLLFCCFNLPLAASTFLKRSWIHGKLLCRLFPLMRYGLLAVSLLSILLITVNRFIMIGHPRIYPRIYRNRNLSIMVATTWIGAFLILIPTYRGIWGQFGLDTTIGSCSIVPDKNGNSPKEFLFIMAFVIPCFCILICYARIFYIVRKAALRSREPVNINSSMRMNQANALQLENNDSYQELVEKDSKISKEEDSEQSSSVSGILSNDKEHLKQQEWQMRPYLSKIRDDEMKYIDTSVESDLPPSLSLLKVCGNAIPLNETEDDQLKIETNLIREGNNSEYFFKPMTPTDEIEAVVTEVPLKTNDTFSDNGKTGKRHYKSAIRTSLNKIKKRKFRNNSTINTSNTSILYPGRMSQKDKRLLKMILVIFVSFVICYLPITMTKVWISLTEMHGLNISGYLLIYLTTCINPIIYVVMSSEYRQAYRSLLLCKIRAKLSQTRHGAGVRKKPSTFRAKPQT